MQVLAIDVGGTNVKILATGQREPRKFASGRTMTPENMVAGVKELAGTWKYDVVALGYPGRVSKSRILLEPRNLAPGWVDFDFAAAFGCPVRIINDAAMQALGSYQGGLLLFLGLGTGLGAAVVADGVVIPMELAHLSWKNHTYEHYLGVKALRRVGRRKWRKYVAAGAEGLIEALHPDDVVLGGGNAKELKKLPERCRLGDNALAFLGGFRLWEDEPAQRPPSLSRARRRS